MTIKPPPIQEPTTNPLGLFPQVWIRWFQDLWRGVLNGTVGVGSITGSQTLDTSYYAVFCDTDSGAITVTLPTTTEGKSYRIINTGTSGNDVTVDGGGNNVRGESTQLVSDEEILIITYSETYGWW